MTILVAIGGVSGSGKSTGARLIQQYLTSADPNLSCKKISLDNFYVQGLHGLVGTDQDPRFCEKLNYDHPDSIDRKRLDASLDKILAGESLTLPKYDFSTHKYGSEEINIPSSLDVAIVESMLALYLDEVFTRADFKFYWDTQLEVAFHRRFFRDIEERGRTPKEINRQMKAAVFPMQDRYVIPSKSKHGVVEVPCIDGMSKEGYMDLIHICADAIYHRLTGKPIPKQDYRKFIIPWVD